MNHTKGKITINKYQSIVDENGKTLLVSAGIARPMSTNPNDESVSNSERIVKCWNMHDELIAAIRNAIVDLSRKHSHGSIALAALQEVFNKNEDY